MSIRSLFPTLIDHGPLFSLKSSLGRNLRQECLMLSKKDREGIDWSEANYLGGYTSYGSLDQLHLFSEPFSELERKIRPRVARYVRRLGLDVPVKELRVSKLWANVMGPRCVHSSHTHPLSVISGTFYVDLPRLASGIKFEDPRFSAFMARPGLRSDSSETMKNYVTLNPRPGDLVLFESWLRHEVPPHRGSAPRISISFNYDWVGV